MQHSLINYNHLIQTHITGLKLKQLQYETGTWKRLLSFMTEENIRFKNRLSEILNDRFNKNLLEEVDRFQGGFIKEDEMIRLLRNDVTEMDILLTKEIFVDGTVSKEIDIKLTRLRNNMMAAESHFVKIKSEFNNFLLANI